MSDPRHLPLLACTLALGVSCASRPKLASQASAALETRRAHVESEPRMLDLRTLEPQAQPTNPYAPIRTRKADVYSWQSEKRAVCTQEPPAATSGVERPLEASAAPGLLAALPERKSDAASNAQPVNPDLVLATLRPALHHCFSRWLDDQVDAQGSVRFKLELGCGGEVEAISAENQGVDARALECLFSAVAPARFAPPVGGHAVVLMPVVFKNAAR